MPQGTQYSNSQKVPDFIVRDRANTIEAAIYDDNTLTAPSSGTVSVFRAEGTAIVDEQSVTVTADKATFAISAGTLPTTEILGDSWLIVWTLTMPDGIAHTFQREAALVRREIHPVVIPDDMTTVHQEASTLLASGQNLQQFLDDSWDMIQRRLLADGRRPSLIMSPHALFDVHRHLAFYLLFLDAASSVGDGGNWDEMAAHHLERYEAQWSRLRFVYDHDEDGVIDAGEEGVSGPAAVYLGGPGGTGKWL